MKQKLFLLRNVLPVVLILSCCSSETAIQEIFSGSAEAPVFLDCRAISPTEISFRFSQPVRMVSLFMDPSMEIQFIEEGEEILVTLTEPLGAGERITADILVEDEHRNTLNVLAPFRSRNNRLPDLFMNEIRTEGSNVNNASTAKVEFVEFLVKSSGNLGALRLYAAGYSLTRPIYEFQPVEVEAGEYIVLHLRTPSPDCIDEISGDLSLSGGPEAIPGVRDFWVPGSAKLIHKTDALYLIDQDDRILDAVLLCEVTGSSWNKAYMGQAAELIADQGKWFPSGGGDYLPGTYVLEPSDAVYSSSTTNTRSISRDQNVKHEGRPENWYITANSNATPGKQNSEKRY